MPYTLSHAAAVLPFVRRPLVGSALVFGSMSPDLLYFVALRPGVDERTHTWWGLVVIDLPVALALLAVFHAFVVPAALPLAPAWARARLVPFATPPRLGVATVASVLVGGATHLVWDACTHHDGWIVRQVPALREWLWVGMPRYHFLQLLSSVLGIALIVWWSARALRRATPAETVPPEYAPPKRPWVVVCAVLGTGVVLAAVNALTTMAGVADQTVLTMAHTMAAGTAPSETQVTVGMVRASIGIVTGVFVALVGYGLLRRARG
ncbi:DUF4184 family protein [Actinokineospora iranica]|uniref:DUF4184 domain-containing protein n=1 Tax=Actinokineospora iranica TaxID=1271860 RepID=A0A1G6X7W9_9PSEU|nr:DUF4184 family protein [Actinokineospora iranica]SDD73396.1 protein of unknown function [Actinokineospora iranica]